MSSGRSWRGGPNYAPSGRKRRVRRIHSQCRRRSSAIGESVMGQQFSFLIARHTCIEPIARTIMASARTPKERDDSIDARCEAMIDKAQRNGVPLDLACVRATELYAAI